MEANVSNPVNKDPRRSDIRRIAQRLHHTAMGDAHYGDALRFAADLPGVTDADLSLLERYATGTISNTDHVSLQGLAVRLRSVANQQPGHLTVKTIVGAQYAYACIQGPGYTLDVQLNAGRSAATSLKETAAELREKAASLIQRAERIEQAATLV